MDTPQKRLIACKDCIMLFFNMPYAEARQVYFSQTTVSSCLQKVSIVCIDLRLSYKPL